MQELVKKYILECEEVFSSNDVEKARELENLIIGAFGEYISGIKNQLHLYTYHKGSTDYLGDIKKLKLKLELFLATDCKPTKLLKDISDKERVMITNNNNNANTNTNTNTNEINLEVLFKEARNEVEKNESISEEDMKEALDKIDEIEQISKLDEPNNKKWFKLRPMMEWVGSKGVTIATTMLNLITAIIKFKS